MFRENKKIFLSVEWKSVIWVGWSLLAFGTTTAYAEVDHCSHGGQASFHLTSGDIIGKDYFTSAKRSDSLHDIACRYNIGVEEIFMANDPLHIDHWTPGEGTQVVVPQQFILPKAPRAGIIVNVPEMRLYYFPVNYAKVVRKPPQTTQAVTKPGEKTKTSTPSEKSKASSPPKPGTETLGEPISKAVEVITHPISMGRMDWRTPLGKARVVEKVKDPTWTPPESIRREHAAKGDMLPAVVPAGPDNPLGRFAMRLSVPGYLIHGTEENHKSFGIGMRVTHGCMRLYNEDVAKLFPRVEVGTPVYLINQPVKLGWQGDTLYMEVSRPLDEDVGIPLEKEEEDMTEAELAREEAKTPEQRKAERQQKDAKRSAYLFKTAMELIQKETAQKPVVLDERAIRNVTNEISGRVVAIGREQLEPSPTSNWAPAPLSPANGRQPPTPPAPVWLPQQEKGHRSYSDFKDTTPKDADHYYDRYPTNGSHQDGYVPNPPPMYEDYRARPYTARPGPTTIYPYDADSVEPSENESSAYERNDTDTGSSEDTTGDFESYPPESGADPYAPDSTYPSRYPDRNTPQ